MARTGAAAHIQGNTNLIGRSLCINWMDRVRAHGALDGFARCSVCCEHTYSPVISRTRIIGTSKAAQSTNAPRRTISDADLENLVQLRVIGRGDKHNTCVRR